MSGKPTMEEAASTAQPLRGKPILQLTLTDVGEMQLTSVMSTKDSVRTLQNVALEYMYQDIINTVTQSRAASGIILPNIQLPNGIQ